MRKIVLLPWLVCLAAIVGVVAFVYLGFPLHRPAHLYMRYVTQTAPPIVEVYVRDARGWNFVSASYSQSGTHYDSWISCKRSKRGFILSTGEIPPSAWTAVYPPKDSSDAHNLNLPSYVFAEPSPIINRAVFDSEEYLAMLAVVRGLKRNDSTSHQSNNVFHETTGIGNGPSDGSE